MTASITRIGSLLVVPLLAVALGCGASMEHSKTKEDPTGATAEKGGIHSTKNAQPATPENVAHNQAASKAASSAERARWRGKTFEEFERSVYKESGPNGKYIVNGDTAITDRKQLKEFFELQVLRELPPPPPHPGAELIVIKSTGIWNGTDRKKLTYCVSSTFGSRQAAVAMAMQQATSAWTSVADVAFSHVEVEDGNCTASNPDVMFDVRPVNVQGEFLARAFFPNEPRPDRNVLIDDTSFTLGPGNLTLAGILRHELGHTLGFRHEQTRPQAGTCFEDNDWIELTEYDAFSVMHYPQCHGLGDWSLNLTEKDKSGAACLYGAAVSFHPNMALCVSPPVPPAPPATPKTKTFDKQSVALDQEKLYPVFKIKPGTRFEVTMTGRTQSPGDPDLYVQFDDPPDRAMRAFACRPYLTGPAESCALDVPSSTHEAFVMVHGYEPGKYTVTVKYTPDTP